MWRLGERESGTGRLEGAVTAYRAALEEQTRERVPLDWAMTQNNLGNALERLDRADWREAWALFPGSVAYIWHAGTKAGIVQDSLAVCGFETRSQIIWAKNNFAIGRGHYHCKHGGWSETSTHKHTGAANGDPIEVEVVTVRERLTRRIARIAAARTTCGVPETDE